MRLPATSTAWWPTAISPTPTTDAVARPQELYAEVVSERVEVRLGYSRVVWGRLDELQPTDVVNPLDLARFFFEGRSRPAWRCRWPACAVPAGIDDAGSHGGAAVHARRVRSARRATSAFNLGRDVSQVLNESRARDVERTSRAARAADDHGTCGLVGFRVSGLREFRSGWTPSADAAGLTSGFPRFTMIGGDFETVRGEWGIRGEVAAFVVDSFQSATNAAGCGGGPLSRGRRGCRQESRDVQGQRQRARPPPVPR